MTQGANMKVSLYSLNMTHCRWPPCCSIHSCSREGKNVVTYCCVSLRILKYRVEFTVLSDQYWNDVFRVPFSLRTTKISRRMRRVGRPGDVRETRSESAWKHCPESLLAWKSVLCEQLLQTTSPCMMTVSMEAPISRQNSFWIPNTFRCYWRTWTARYPDLAVPGYFLWGDVQNKVYETGPAEIDCLK